MDLWITMYVCMYVCMYGSVLCVWMSYTLSRPSWSSSGSPREQAWTTAEATAVKWTFFWRKFAGHWRTTLGQVSQHPHALQNIPMLSFLSSFVCWVRFAVCGSYQGHLRRDRQGQQRHHRPRRIREGHENIAGGPDLQRDTSGIVNEFLFYCCSIVDSYSCCYCCCCVAIVILWL